MDSVEGWGAEGMGGWGVKGTEGWGAEDVDGWGVEGWVWRVQRVGMQRVEGWGAEGLGVEGPCLSLVPLEPHCKWGITGNVEL